MGEGSLIIEAARRGEAWAETELLRIVRGFARHACRGGADPDWEDVAQETCRRLFAGALQAFRPGGPERSWLYSIVKATRIQLHRSNSRRARRDEAAVLAPADSGRPESRTLLHQLLQRLPENCREVLARAFFDGATPRDLAAELGLVESSVRSRLTRCLQEARRLL